MLWAGGAGGCYSDFSLSMIVSDLPSPAEAGFAKAGNPVPPPDHVRGRLFRDHVLTNCASGR